MLNNESGQLSENVKLKSSKSKAIIIVKKLEEIAKKIEVFLKCYEPEVALPTPLSL